MSIIVNPGLGLPYLEHGAPELKVAHGWVPFWVEEGGKNNYPRPEWYPKPLGATGWAQGIQSTHARHIGGVFQVVELPASVSGFCVLCEYRYESHGASGGGGIGSRLGVEPTGRTDLVRPGPVDPARPLIDSIVWGPWWSQDGQNAWDGKSWRTLSVEVGQVLSRQVTIVLLSQCRFPAHNNHSFWTGARVDAGETPAPDPDPVGGPLAAIAADVRAIRLAVAALAGGERSSR